jgi:hypothetical protein
MKPSRNGIIHRIVSALGLALGVARGAPLGLREAAIEGRTDPIDPTTRYEGSDLYPRAVFLTGVGVLVGTGVIILLVYPVFSYLRHERAEVSPVPTAAARGGNPVPPEPRIQASPTTDLHDFRVWEESQLHDYHWVDRQKQTVSIPIDEAIRIVARRGIPPQPDPGGTTYFDPRAGTRVTGFEGKVEPEPK